MTSLAQAIDALEPIEDAWRGSVPETWLQGRTAYGGFSAALALHAAKASDADLPPLRSAHVAFVGPLAGAVMVTAHRLRRGRNAAFVQADVESEAGLGLRATFVFMAPRESAVDHVTGEAPGFPLPDAETPRLCAPPTVAFAQNFEMVEPAGAVLGPAEWQRWVRLRDRDGLDPEMALIAVADALPPAALRLLGRPAPVSSMTWQVDVVGAPETRDGWWLMRTDSDHAREGFSSQRMTIHDAHGRHVAEQMQGVAMFV